jgi:hypothetical protein
MRRLLWLIPLLWCSPAWATFTMNQVKTNNSCGASTCAVTVTSTTAGHALIEAIMAGSSSTITASTGCTGSWTFPAATQTGNATSGYIAMGYCTNASSVTSVSMTITSGGTVVGVVWEVSSGNTITFDTDNANLVTTNCTSCTGTALTLGGSNDFIGTVASCGGACSAITTYSADPATPWPDGDGVAHLLNTASGTAPTWTQSPTSNLASASIAVKDASGSTAHTAMPVVY